MTCNFTLDFWKEEGWYVGKLREVPGVFSQGKNLEELKTNIKDAYDLVMQETVPTPVKEFESTELSLEVP
ncbi:MAG: type II toxin-antitoxin system HicB family antitoxin [Gemmatimonadetes bacterium]|nr:type II toxin-antitoxin system HicB family antitoxin [Gemmatimonadota bacterium]MDD9949074.1 type II toxin-antitoxin system HicB family antitoxin [candidate division Zixibacteria bacterium]MYH19413.1 type II toxin-antitoxin system HicB family antitoxin [Gemmatimonadota bacterium]